MCRLIILANVNGAPAWIRPASSNALPSVVAIAAMPSGASRPGRAPSIYTEGRKALEPLQAARGPQRALEPSPNPICVQNVKITPNAK